MINNDCFNINFFNKNKIKFNDNAITKRQFENLKITSFNDNILTAIDAYKDKYELYKLKCEKVYKDNLLLNVLVWNCQRINKKMGRREIKINFMKDILNYNKLDIIYLIDVGDFKDGLFFNGYNKLDDGRNVLFIINDIKEDFIVDKDNMIIKGVNTDLVFTYITPNTINLKQIDIIQNMIKERKTIFGDFNYESNFKYLDKRLDFFYGEDTIRCGVINYKPLKFYAIDAPSDHYAILFLIHKEIKHSFPLRLKEITVHESIKKVKKILNGEEDLDFKPKIVIKQFKNKFNDSEAILNKMIHHYIDNNVQLAYRKYNYLWRYTRKEPFLGTYVNSNIVNTFSKHLRAENNKQYEDQIIIEEDDLNKFNLDSFIIKTKSVALTAEYNSLSSVYTGIKEYVEYNKDLKKIKKDEDMNNYNIIKNVLKIANKYKNHMIANTFFLVKNQKLEDFNDVRMIIIIPTFIKIYETLIYNDVCEYVKGVIDEDGSYQFGGIKGGSCYDAIYCIRNKFVKYKSKAIFVSDMTKGYDSVDLNILKDIFIKINDRRLSYLLCNWLIMIKNLDYLMNRTRVKRTRGIGMGLSLSPAIFVLYCHQCYNGLDKRYFVQYIDDLSIIFPEVVDPDKAYTFIENLIERFANYGLIINKKKSVVVSNSKEYIDKFKNEFEITTEDKFLGRELAIDSNGWIVGDDRFFSCKGITIASFPNFNIEGIKNMIMNGAILAKLRYRFMCWATSSKLIKKKIFTSNYVVFKGKNKEFSYVQLLLALPNIFAFFIDAFEVKKLMEDIKRGINEVSMDILFKNKLMTDIDIYDKAITKAKFDYKIIDDVNVLNNGRIFMNKVFDIIKQGVISEYEEEKKLKGIKTYNNIYEAAKSKYYKNFKLIQNIIWMHQYMSKNKTIFSLEVVKLLDKILKNYIDMDNDIWDIYKEPDLNNIVFEDLILPNNYNDDETWNKFIRLECQTLWSTIDLLIKLDKKRSNNKKFNNIFKITFKILSVGEIILNNNTFNNMNIEIMEVLFRIKLVNLDSLLDNFFNLATNCDIENIIAYDPNFNK